jgi:uncharacterized cupin superfamily protein
MQKSELKNMINGWFIGNFEPTLYKTNDVEVAVKEYKAGDTELRHFHKIATEFTAIIAGEVVMNGQKYVAGDIIKINPGESTDFIVIQDTKSVVVKIPGVSNDKYLGENND